MFYACILADRRWMSENTQKVQLVQCTVRTHSGFCLASPAWQKMTDVCWRYVDHMAVMWSAIYCCEGVRILQLPRLLQASSWFPLNSSYKPNSSLHFTTLLCVLWPTSKPYTMMTVHIFSWLQYVMLCFLLISWCTVLILQCFCNRAIELSGVGCWWVGFRGGNTNECTSPYLRFVYCFSVQHQQRVSSQPQQQAAQPAQQRQQLQFSQHQQPQSMQFSQQQSLPRISQGFPFSSVGPFSRQRKRKLYTNFPIR